MLTKIEDDKNPLADDSVRVVVEKTFSHVNLSDKRVLLIIPDSTRTGPIGLFFKLIAQSLLGKVKKLDVLVALGTHHAMSEDALNQRLEITCGERKTKYKDVDFYNHVWDDPNVLGTIGTITADEMHEISDGLFREAVDVALNKIVFNYDHLIILGPVFPHEVVGFSGGNKYLFPGIAGAEIINFFHWLGAMITNVKINGVKYTPVRKVVDKAASFLKIPKLCFCLVVVHGKLHGVFSGTPEDSWDKASNLSSEKHIVYKDRKFSRVLGIAPKMYDDIWVAGKVMYKLEPVIEDGGELIIYAPHIDEVSYTHGKILDSIGYHTRDYFLAQMEKFPDVPKGVMAHSTHVKGTGTYENGQEKPRVNVILATRIPEERCRKINLGYRNPKDVDIEEYRDRESEGYLLVEHAGEMLYRMK